MVEFFTGVVSTDVGSWSLAVDVLHPVSVDERRRLRVGRRVGDATTRRRSVDENVLRRRLRVLAANIWSVLLSSHQQCLSSCTVALLHCCVQSYSLQYRWLSEPIRNWDLTIYGETEKTKLKLVSVFRTWVQSSNVRFAQRVMWLNVNALDYYWGLWVSVLVLISLGKIT